MKETHFFDLDWTLWKTDSKLSLINKKQPEKVLFRIDPMYQPMLKTYWQKYNLPIKYNGQKWWLSKDIWDIVKRKNKNIKLEDLGISYRDWSSKEILKNQKDKTHFLLSNIEHLKDKYNISINFITARSDKNNHEELLNDLKKSIYLKLKKNIDKMYFVNDLDDNLSDDVTAMKKAKIILEHLIGYKIRKNKFIELKQNESNNVHFYDDNMKNIEVIKNIQYLFEDCLKYTDPLLKKEILNRTENNSLFYYIHQITNNDINPFKTIKIELLKPNNVSIFN